MADRNIVQIMPADGWAAIFIEDGVELITPLVGWALVNEPGAPAVVEGLVAWDKVELCSTQENFSRYVYMTEMGDADFDDEGFDEDDFDEDDDIEDDEPYDPKSGLLN